MPNIQEVDPSSIRFTQEVISLNFQKPFQSLSVRDAVRRISNGEMQANDFKIIQVYVHDGIMWSVDNRRLWVFRRARCGRIRVCVLKKEPLRFKEVLAQPERYDRLKAVNHFPGVKGPPDAKFNKQFPQPRCEKAVIPASGNSSEAKVAVHVDEFGTASGCAGGKGSRRVFQIREVESQFLRLKPDAQSFADVVKTACKEDDLTAQRARKKDRHHVPPLDRSQHLGIVPQVHGNMQNAPVERQAIAFPLFETITAEKRASLRFSFQNAVVSTGGSNSLQNGKESTIIDVHDRSKQNLTFKESREAVATFEPASMRRKAIGILAMFNKAAVDFILCLWRTRFFLFGCLKRESWTIVEKDEESVV